MLQSQVNRKLFNIQVQSFRKMFKQHKDMSQGWGGAWGLVQRLYRNIQKNNLLNLDKTIRSQ